MRADRINAVAYAIEAAARGLPLIPDLGFSMSYVRRPNPAGWRGDMDRTGHSCGTVGCIAGFTLTLEDQECGLPLEDDIDAWPEYGSEGYITCAAARLDLDVATAARLFVPWDLSLPEVTPAQAVRTLPGQVDWSETIAEQAEARRQQNEEARLCAEVQL